MTRITLDPRTVSQLDGLSEIVDLCDVDGRTIGFFQPVKVCRHPISLRDLSPFSDEEVAERCKQQGGRPLNDIMQDLRGR